MKKYIPYAQREEWNDVEPIFQDDGPDPIVPIAYSAEFMDAMNYFRSVSLAEEYSDRSLGLTKHCIMLNAANYTVWYFRRKILFSMENVSQLLQEECTWLNEMILVHPKNYQIWHHRKEIVSKSQVYENELDFSAKALSDDSKNYHAWAYRQWLYKTFKKLPFEVEMQYTDYLLEKDVLNNSAWNQRWFISHLSNSPNFEQSEVEYALAKIDKCVDNEAVWNYLLAYLRQRTLDKKVYLDIQRRLETQWLTALDNRHVLYFAIVLYSELKSFMDAPRDCTPYYDKLVEIDGIRELYWQELRAQYVAQQV